MENWKDITQLPDYQVSNLGNIRNKRFNKSKKTFKKKDGRIQVMLNNKGKRYMRFVHRLVAEAFIPNPDNKPQVNHLNGNPSDNRIDNLEWCTPKENIFHSRNITKNGAVVSKLVIENHYQNNPNMKLSDFVQSLINLCK